MPTDAILNALNTHSFEALAQNRAISDNQYVYAKKSGTVTNESGLGHAFTATSTNLRTLANLREEIKTKFGETALEATSPLLEEFESGETQLKVKDLRTIFTVAESVKLNEIARELTTSFGSEMGNAFVTTMGDAIASRGIVSSDDICAMLSEKYGINTANFAMERYGLDHFSGEMLKTLPENLQELDEQFSNISLTENGSQALRDFFASPMKSLDDLLACVEKNFPGKDYVTYAKNRAPKEPSFKDGMAILLLTDKYYKGQLCYAFGKELDITTTAEQAGMGLSELASNGTILTDAIKNTLRTKASIFKEAEKALNEVSNKFLSEHLFNGEISTLLEKEAKKLCNKVIIAGELDVTEKCFTADSIRTHFEAPLESLYARMTDVNAQIAYEIEQHPQWTPTEQAAFREAMLFCHAPEHSPFPDRAFPIIGNYSSSPSSHIATALKSNLYKQLEPKLKPMFLKLSGFFGAQEGQFLSHLRELSELPADKQTPQYMAKLIFDDENLDIAARIKEKNINDVSEYFRMTENLRSEFALNFLFKLNPDLQNGFEEKVASHMKQGLSREDAVSLAGATGQISVYIANLQNFVCVGIKPDVVAKLLLAPLPQTLTLNDFVLGSDRLPTIRTRAEAMTQFNIDFPRAGNSSVTINTANGSTVVRNDPSTLSEEERKTYNDGNGASLTQTVFTMLDQLCGDNEAQFRTALTALTQAGPVSYQKTIAPLITEGKGHPQHEHAPLDFTLSQDANGVIHLHAESPKDDPYTYLSVDIEIDQAGESRLTSFTQSTVAPSAH